VTGAYLTALLAAIVALALLAKRLHVPYPVVFVIGGLAIALIPGVPAVELQPDLVFLLFLPPLIFGDGWTTDYRSFVRYRKPIFALALGLVVCTSIAVGFVAHWMIGIPLAIGFLLGGVLSPTDAVATDAIAEEVEMPRRITSIISGESLINDASGLVIYRFALAAVATGAFSLAFAFVQFLYVVAAGVAIGLIGGWLIVRLMVAIRKKGLGDQLIAVSISLVTPFALYVPADAIGGSGVLAALTGGIYLSRKSTQIFDADSRIAAASVWNLLFFIFNGAAFVLIGLQLRSIVRDLPEYSLPLLIGWGLAVWLVLVAVRFAWVYAVALVSWGWFPLLRTGEGTAPTWQALFVLSFAGMRGIVSLAAALAIPELGASGAPFPDRALILFITFVVILVSLVGEGLTLPVLIRWFDGALGLDEDTERALALARARTAAAAREHLRELEPTFSTPAEWEIAGRLQAAYDDREAHFRAHAEGAAPDDDARQHEIEQRLRGEAHGAERRALLELRRSGEIGDDVYRSIEWDLDLAESRLTS
jgi:CPA1 family monovalent cation:H+ antiporter